MEYLKYVNILQGTKSDMRFSNGNTLPMTQMPFGMISFAPQTNGANNNKWWFSPDNPYIEGIRITHQPSPWIGDYGTLLITPQSDVIDDRFPAAWSGYRREDAVYAPDFLSVKFLRANALVELAPAERSASVRVSFDTYCSKCISLFNVMGNGSFETDSAKDMIYVRTDGFASGHAKNFAMYAAVHIKNGSIDYDKMTIVNNGQNNGAVHLMLKDDATLVELDVAISYISFEQAVLNMQEICGKDLEAVRANCTKSWEDYLHTIEIDTKDEQELRTFYSCMYRTGVYPHKAYEIAPDGSEVHYSPYTGSVHPGVRYTGNGFWDTYRTVLPLFTKTRPQLYADVVRSAVSDYKEGGWLPRWVSIGEVGCMPSTLLDSVIAHGAAAGIVPADVLEQALEGMLHHANVKSDDKSFGREGVEEYNRYGYVPGDMYKESVNLTLDFAYGDYCIAQVAKALGKADIEQEYLERSKRYKNLFDKETGFMRAKNVNGDFIEHFDPYCWGRDYTEGCAWQTTFSVVHDLEGLADLFGGKEKLLAKLDELFNQKPFYRVGGYGVEIHEMTEMAAADFGMCAISNQPSFHLPYIYAHFGEYAKAQYWVERMCDEAFSYADDGFPGDEDTGSMAAWYILSRIGMYPLCPADDYFVKINSKYNIKLRKCAQNH
ncbi:MAG: GH92 family glycosyl hydrolase [Clostridia bacterium]|nr:GH92 family glycosyl hydrolase [Clostridia bacterium]